MRAYSLDKLEQLDQNGQKRACTCTPKSRETYQKRARAKAMTIPIIKGLSSLNSPLKRQYERAFHCGSVIEQRGNLVTSKYCGCRWCLVCNRIRTGNLIKGYEDVVNAFQDPHMVTLTIPNVKGYKLKSTIEEMTHQFSLLNRSMKRKKGLRIKGIRKLEVTYNKQRKDFHPHFHVIVDGQDVAIEIVGQWLKRFPEAVEAAQDIRPTDEGSLKELFKYFTKIASKDTDYNSKAMDVMFRAIHGKRVVQPYGITKVVSEDIDEIQSQVIDFKDPVEHKYWFWQLDACDWYAIGNEIEAFSGFQLSEGDIKYLNYIKDP